jgi:hypothetical protein
MYNTILNQHHDNSKNKCWLWKPQYLDNESLTYLLTYLLTLFQAGTGKRVFRQ